jgi:hypothetical protein
VVGYEGPQNEAHFRNQYQGCPIGYVTQTD